MNNDAVDDESLWKLYSPKPNPWFSSEIVYEGWGAASFEKPAGIIEGQTKIIVMEFGNLEIVMEYEKLNTEIPIPGMDSIKISKFLQANLSEGNIVSIGVENINPCIVLKVKTDEGVFTSEGKVYYSQGLGFD